MAVESVAPIKMRSGHVSERPSMFVWRHSA